MISLDAKPIANAMAGSLVIVSQEAILKAASKMLTSISRLLMNMRKIMILKTPITRRMKSWAKPPLSPKPRERGRGRTGFNWGKAVSLSSARIGVACLVHGSRKIARGDIYVFVYEKKNGSLCFFENNISD